MRRSAHSARTAGRGPFAGRILLDLSLKRMDSLVDNRLVPSSMEITALRSAGQQTHNAHSQFKNGRFVGNDPRGRSFVTDCNF